MNNLAPIIRAALMSSTAGNIALCVVVLCQAGTGVMVGYWWRLACVALCAFIGYIPTVGDYITSREGDAVTLSNARKIWRWRGANTWSEREETEYRGYMAKQEKQFSGEFRYAKLENGEWGCKYKGPKTPAPETGDWVTVEEKNGSNRRCLLGKQVDTSKWGDRIFEIEARESLAKRDARLGVE